MKDIFAKRAREQFYSVMKDFAESLIMTFPECEATKDWSLWFNNVLTGDEAKMKKCVEQWVDAMEEPLQKTKYSKAVQSITKKPVMVYHAIIYRDIDSADNSSTYFRELELPKKLRDERMNGENAYCKDIFWEYFKELNTSAYAATRRVAPRVPTSEEITEDIKKRKNVGSKDAPSNDSNGPVLQQGIYEVWDKLCAFRKAAAIHPPDLVASLHKLGLQTHEGRTVCEACKERVETVQSILVAEFPYLNETPAFSETEWTLIDKAFAMSTMQNAIPVPMMRGIEDVATKLVKDISEGRADLNSLNVEAIGQQVLSGVSKEEMSSFANNLDQIIPALQRMQ